MHKVVSMVNEPYFKFGKAFLESRKNVNAEFVVYGPDLNTKQQSKLAKADIKYVKCDYDLFHSQMQFLKFVFIDEQNTENGEGITFVDWDTYFIKDWGKMFDGGFDLGICLRNDYIKERILRAVSNGGVIFGHQTPKFKTVCKYARLTMEEGGHYGLPEYDEIWKTLEEGRPKHKTHYRTNLRWWVDQVFLSSIALTHLRNNNWKPLRKKPRGYKFKTHIGEFKFKRKIL